MLIKATLLGICVASTPLYFAASQNPEEQDPARDAEAVPAVHTPQPGDVDSLRAEHAAHVERLEARHAEEIEQLRAALDAAIRRAERCENRGHELSTQLDECMDFLLVPRTHRSGCRPSRSLMVHYQWMRKNGHDDKANIALKRVVQQYGQDNRHLNSLAWNLMTDEDTSGKFDELALAVAQRMQKSPKPLSHRQLDTVALAKFLNGYVDEAIALQRRAIQNGGKGDDYRRRLRTYEAAKRAAEAAVEPESKSDEKKKSKSKPRKRITDE